MLVDIALARDGFIKKKNTIVAPTNLNNFELCLKSLFDFVSLDLLGFNGVSGQISIIDDPTNSLFFFNIDEGKYLYQITSATPIIHLNKLIWNFNAIMLEDVNRITNLPFNSTFLEVIKGLPNKTLKGGNYEYEDNQNTEIKANFDSLNIIKLNLLENRIATLKIKCGVNPLFNQTLASNSSDGSYVFLFPIYISTNGTITDTLTMTTTTTSTTIKLGDILSNYSNQIKSIELLPFLWNWRGGTNHINFTTTAFDATYDTTTNAVIVSIGTSETTLLGIYLTSVGENAPQYANGIYNGGRLPINYFPYNIVQGGGVRGFAYTPNGVYSINKNKNYNITLNNAKPQYFCYVVKNDGFIIAGSFTINIAPIFINFYTDSSGQLLMAQNSTYIAQNRQIEIEKQAQINETNQKVVSGTLLGLANAGIGSLTGSKYALAQGIGTFIQASSDLINANENIERNYFNSLKIMAEKRRSDSVIAQHIMTNITGDSNISDISTINNLGYFEIYIEFNYSFEESGGIREYYFQIDYDYSVNFNKNQKLVVFSTNLWTTIQKLLGLLNDEFFEDNYVVGAGYNFLFRFRAFGSVNPLYSNLINLPIRY